jgi:hypothetical protein
MPKIYRCQHCNYNVTVNKNEKGANSAKHKMGYHYEIKHKELIPPDMSGYRWFYYLLTKKDKGSCVICHNETDFNEISMKYSRFCNNPACKQKYKEERDKRMIGKYGKLYLCDDPEHQKKMQQGRRIAGIYTWSDGKSKFNYLSSYEKDFLRYLDVELHWPVSDIMAPSPHTYEYEYEGKKHFYMPDFFIPSLNLEIEIKDDGSAKNINQESREKDKIKDELMKSLSNLFNYIKIINKDYTQFNQLLNSDN